MDYNDYELFYLVSENDENALDILLKKYDKLIWSICYTCAKKFFYYITDIDLEDLVQEARIALYYALKSYNPNEEFLFYSFVFLIVKRKATSLLVNKYKKKLDIVYLDSDENFYQICIDVDARPDSIALENELEMMLINFKNTLNFDDSIIFDLKYSSFSYDDIAKIMETNIKSIDNKLSKIRNKLKKYLLNL